jgi:transposase InsO family protein
LHQTLQLELLNEHEPFTSIEDAQAAIDAWRAEYNADRPHQSLGMAFPTARFAPATGRQGRQGGSRLGSNRPDIDEAAQDLMARGA